MKITNIKVTSGFSTDISDYRIAKGEFKLGLGPCGKEVVGLSTTLSEGCLIVAQLTADGEVKDFIYPLSQLAGRVEVTALPEN